MSLLGMGCQTQGIIVFLEISDFVVSKPMLLMAILYYRTSRVSPTVMQAWIQDS